jgi:hypothetical protein
MAVGIVDRRLWNFNTVGGIAAVLLVLYLLESCSVMEEGADRIGVFAIALPSAGD